MTSTLSPKRRPVLITGGTGLLGINWACAMREQYAICLGTHRRRAALRGVDTRALDFTSPGALERSIDGLSPVLIVHAVGMTDVDACERDPALALEVNARYASNVADIAARRQIRLVYISSDHLFSGAKPFCDESQAPEPMNAYARSKLEGEHEVAARCPDALILRTNFFGWGHAFRKSFSDWILEGLRAGRRLDMYTDSYFTPILVDDLARAVHSLVDAGATGIYHVAGDERLSKHEFALRLAAAFAVSAETVKPCLLRSSRHAAPRPEDLSLSNLKARKALGRPLGGVDEFLRELRVQEGAGRALETQSSVTE